MNQELDYMMYLVESNNYQDFINEISKIEDNQIIYSLIQKLIDLKYKPNWLEILLPRINIDYQISFNFHLDFLIMQNNFDIDTLRKILIISKYVDNLNVKNINYLIEKINFYFYDKRDNLEIEISNKKIFMSDIIIYGLAEFLKKIKFYNQEIIRDICINVSYLFALERKLSQKNILNYFYRYLDFHEI